MKKQFKEGKWTGEWIIARDEKERPLRVYLA